MLALEDPMRAIGLYPQADLGDGAWSLAIMITLLWPVSIFGGYCLAFYGFTKLPRTAQYVLWLLVPLLWAVVLMWFFTQDYEAHRAEQQEFIERMNSGTWDDNQSLTVPE